MGKEAGEQGRMRRRGRGKGGKESIKSMDMVLTKHTKAEGLSWKRECRCKGRKKGWNAVEHCPPGITQQNNLTLRSGAHPHKMRPILEKTSCQRVITVPRLTPTHPTLGLLSRSCFSPSSSTVPGR